MHRPATKNKTNKTNNTNRNDKVKIYFPSIPIQVLQHALHGAPNQNKKQNQNNTQNNTQLDKYLCSETQKTIIYGTTSILEIHNNEPYTIYPSDKMILTSSIPTSRIKLPQSQPQSQLQLLIDYSTMKRSQTSYYQIPYNFKVHSCIVKKYKITPTSDTCFVIEYKDNKIYDFYVLAKMSVSVSAGIGTNRIELDNFIKEDIISFLLMLNLY
jgi:hypothetical protein